jgi:3-deoxy-D-manno-octulosonic-acid transferase
MNRLIPVINAKPEYLWIIAPHDITSSTMDLWAKELHQSSTRYSVWDSSQEVRVLFIDNVGMLASLYQFACMAYVGGGFGKGLHNILEPVGFGIPVLFAKLRKPEKFPEALQSQMLGCGFEIQTSEDLMAELSRMEQPEKYAKACEAAKNWVNSNLGSSEKIVSHLLAKHFTP